MGSSCFNLICILVLALLFPRNSFAQHPVPPTIVSGNAPNEPLNLSGAIKGRVKDTVYKFVLSSASVAVYNQVDSSLLKFTIPNNLGEFSLQKLPVNVPLNLRITHVGYSPYQKAFLIKDKDGLIDFDWIYMSQNSGKENTLNEVTITAYAPVRMNGDTIEFNPRAFKMDPNATTEDLMRILPGMVIWGDGDITYNGKKINSLLVDGKPFIGGGNFATATQNLPKEVIDKIQVYSQQNDINPLDSTLNANLVLKADKKMGYFGKAGFGYGSNNRYAADGMLSGYTKKLQLSAILALNNVNKTAENINTLIRSSSYKGEANSVDYQSDFKKPGINSGKMAGSHFQYDFTPVGDLGQTNRLTGDYFFKQNTETINSKRTINTTLKADSVLRRDDVNENLNRSTSNGFNSTYLLQKEKFNFTFLTDASIGDRNYFSNSQGKQWKTGFTAPLSESSVTNTDILDVKKIVLDASFDYHNESLNTRSSARQRKNLLDRVNVRYRFSHDSDHGNRENRSSLLSFIDPAQNRSFNRRYITENAADAHLIYLSYPKLRQLLFGGTSLGGTNLEVNAKLNVHTNNFNTLVFDEGAVRGSYQRNLGLTNDRQEKIQDLQPQLIVSRNFYKGLTTRFNRRIDIYLRPTLQYYEMKSAAIQAGQNLSYAYRRFIPSASLEYANHQYGEFEFRSQINYNSKVLYPGVEQIAPLLDSANVLYIKLGNARLRPEYQRIIAWKASIETRTAKNPFRVDLLLEGLFIKDKIADSSFYDNSGRRTDYAVNLRGDNYKHIQVNARKAFSPNKSHTFRFGLLYNAYAFRSPQYLDAALMINYNQINNFDLELNYSYLDVLHLNVKQGLNLYSNFQNVQGISYKGSNSYTTFSGAIKPVKNLTLSSNLDLNISKAENQPNFHYAIWNANCVYRFLPGNKGEIKFAALDLLKENKSIINNTTANIQTFGVNNVLQQYFMLSLSYFPRKFGK